MVSLDSSIVIMRLIGREYFVVLALSPEGNLGRGRYELRKAELKLAKELAL
jgi:predicted regulator of Ras-like GTPase activity (Roadblock/LC7/MglB family)